MERRLTLENSLCISSRNLYTLIFIEIPHVGYDDQKCHYTCNDLQVKQRHGTVFPPLDFNTNSKLAEVSLKFSHFKLYTNRVIQTKLNSNLNTNPQHLFLWYML